MMEFNISRLQEDISITIKVSLERKKENINALIKVGFYPGKNVRNNNKKLSFIRCRYCKIILINH